MAVRANISKGYIWRPGLIGVFALAFSGWFLYDGTVKYPLQQQQYQEYTRINQEHTNPNEAGRAWEAFAAEKGWPTTKPDEKKDKDIFTQKLLAGITCPIGLYFMATFLMGMGRWVEADENGLRAKNGKETDFASITSIDKSRWDSKGIAIVHYQHDGQAGRITLDDWKFEREPTRQIYDAIVQRMPGGDTEDADQLDADQSDAETADS